jgi:hypothetical protein
VGTTTDAVVRESADDREDLGTSSPAPTNLVTTRPSAASGDT